MASFQIKGRFAISFEKRKGGRTLVFDDFWSIDAKAFDLGPKRGCYVFAIQTRRGLTPIYVGKATKTFKQETFNPTNKHKYQNGFSDYAVGTPVMFFVVHPSQRGRANKREIGEIEDFLIQTGVAKNPDLQNVKGAQRPKWSIRGVVRGGQGNLGKPVRDFRKLFALAS